MTDDTTEALRLAGFALAHAAYSIEDGETLCTLAAILVGDDLALAAFEADTIPESVDIAHEHLRERLEHGGHAALVVDGFVTLTGGSRTDALIIELFGPGARSLGTVAQPYRAAHPSRIPFMGRESGFAILGEPIISDGIQVPDAARVVLDSARGHPKAARFFKSQGRTKTSH